MLLVKICDKNDKLLFAGWVPEEAVAITGGLSRPTTATISVPVTDLMSWLAQKKCSCEIPGAMQSLAVNGDVLSCMICHRVIGDIPEQEVSEPNPPSFWESQGFVCACSNHKRGEYHANPECPFFID